MLKFIPIKNKFKKEVLIGNDTHYEIKNSRDELIGRIYYSRVGKFMHWCFFPDECDGHDLFFTNGCLKEISTFITKLYGKNKND